MANSADPDQMPTDMDLHCLQMQGVSGLSRTGVNFTNVVIREHCGDQRAQQYRGINQFISMNFFSCHLSFF